MLLCFYSSNFVRIAWNGVLSEYFLAINGVKQGGVLSPIIFTIYIDGLLVKLSSANVGCYVGIFFVGALAYADDIVLLAPTPSAMRKLLQICEQYAQEYSMTFSFNAKKSKYTVAAPRNRRHLLLSGNICPFVIDDNWFVIDVYCFCRFLFTPWTYY